MENRHLLIGLIALLIVIAGFVLMNNVLADFDVASGNNSINIIDKYGPKEILKGTIKINLEDEPFDSLLTGFDSNITLYDFLIANGLKQNKNFTCTSPNCVMDYSPLNEAGQKNFTLDNGGSKIIGFIIQGDDNPTYEVLAFSMNITSNAAQSCTSPYVIDVLDNNDTESMWMPNASANDYTCTLSDPYGGYQVLYRETSPADIDERKACNKITLPASPDVEIGADVTGTGPAVFDMSLFYAGEYEGGYYDERCTATASESGQVSCIINKSINQENDFFVCINRDSGNTYTINYDQHNAKGYWENDPYQESYDWEIFVNPGAYAAPGEIKVDNNTFSYIESNIETYIGERYNSDCSEGCIVPIKITSNKNNQGISISDVFLEYRKGPGTPELTTIYDMDSSPSEITMNYTVLNLEKAGIVVPNTYGNHTLELELDGDEIAEQKINILKKPVINAVIPTTVPAAANIIFKADVTGPNITYYKWKFGDNTTATETSINKTNHKYTKIGTYTLKLTARNSLGEDNKTFTITVDNPKDYLNDTLKQSQKDISNIRNQLNNLSSWEKDYLDSKIGLSVLEANLTKLKVEFEQASGSSEQYITILNKLNSLRIPNLLEVTENASGGFIINKNLVKLNDLKTLGAGTPDEEGTEAQYQEAVFAWTLESINIDIIEKVYSLYYTDTFAFENVASSFKIGLDPINGSLEDVYFVINARKNTIGFKDSSLQLKDLNASTGVVFPSLTGTKNVEFILPGRISILDTPIYTATNFESLALISQIGPCNRNDVCEGDRGENPDNCRTDCTAWGWFIIWLIILLLIFLVAYIALQEWYKKNYEKHLFKNKDELFNLINFIDNAEKHGLKKEEIVKRLKQKGWSVEQINYAYKKLKGKRTGMWEIPVFKFAENKKVREELAKRKKVGYKDMPNGPTTTKPIPSQPTKGQFGGRPRRFGMKKPMPGKPGPQGRPIRQRPIPMKKPMPGKPGPRPFPGKPMGKPPMKKPMMKPAGTPAKKKGLFSKKISIPTSKKDLVKKK